MRKLDNPGRRRLQNWLDDNAALLKTGEIDDKSHIEYYSVDGVLVGVIDVYSKTDGKYRGFELLTPSSGSKVSDAINELKSILQD